MVTHLGGLCNWAPALQGGYGNTHNSRPLLQVSALCAPSEAPLGSPLVSDPPLERLPFVTDPLRERPYLLFLLFHNALTVLSPGVCPGI